MDLITVPYSKRMFCELVMRTLNNSFPSDAFALSENQVMLHIDQSVSDKIPKLAYQNAQLEGVLSVAEAFLMTFTMTVTSQDPITHYWYVTLPQPPISLPLGYSINDAYFTDPSFGASNSIFFVKAKRVAYRRELPAPPGLEGWIEGSTLWIKAPKGTSLLNKTLRVQMPTGRTTDFDATINMPDDVIWTCFNEVIQRLTDQFRMPRDNIKDNQPSGNNKQKEGVAQ